MIHRERQTAIGLRKTAEAIVVNRLYRRAGTRRCVLLRALEFPVLSRRLCALHVLAEESGLWSPVSRLPSHMYTHSAFGYQVSEFDCFKAIKYYCTKPAQVVDKTELLGVTNHGVMFRAPCGNRRLTKERKAV